MHRLRSSAEFARVMREGARATSPLVSCAVRLTEDPAAQPRLGIAASRALGGAVRRNRAKRRLREAARVSAEAFSVGTETVLVAREGTLTAKFQILADSAAEIVRTAGARARAAA